MLHNPGCLLSLPEEQIHTCDSDNAYVDSDLIRKSRCKIIDQKPPVLDKARIIISCHLN